MPAQIKIYNINIFHSKILTVLCYLAKHLNHTTFKSRYFAVTTDSSPFPINLAEFKLHFLKGSYLLLNSFELSFLSRGERLRALYS